MSFVRVCGWVDVPTAIPRRQYVCHWEPAGKPPGYSGWAVPKDVLDRPTVGRPRSQPVTSKATGSGVSAGRYYKDPCISAIRAQPGSPPTAGSLPVPAQTRIDFNQGWTGRARSIASFPRAGYVEFTMTASVVGAVVGLNNEYRRTGYNDIKFAFYFSHGVVRIVERGEIKQHVGTYIAPTRFRIQRRGGEVRYYVGETLVRTTLNDSLPMHLDAALYSGGDTVDSPEIAAMDDVADGSGELHGLVGIGSEGAYAQSIGYLLPLTSEGRAGVRGDGTLHALSGIGGDYAYGVGAGELRPLTGFGEGGLFVPRYAIGSGALVMLTGAGLGLTGTIGGGAGTLSSLVGLGGEGVYGESQGSMAALIGYGDDYEGPNEAVISQALYVAAGARANVDLLVVMNERMEVTAVVAAQLLLDAGVAVSLEIASSMMASALLHAGIVTTLSASTTSVFDDPSPQVWVVNADTHASTRYEQYGFNSFAQIGDAYYGAKRDGIYLLDGDDDNGEPVQAMVSLGSHDFEVSALKRVENCYLGVSSSGRMFLRVVADEREYLYAARSASENMRMHRVDVGKGLRANFLEFEIYNADGDDFELGSVEFVVVPLSRRI